MKTLFCVIRNLLLIIPSMALADKGVGGIAESFIEPVSILSDFISTASLIIGMSFIFGGFMRYLQYRINPLAAPISTVITLIILGTVLILLPMAYKITEGGIPYSLMK